MICVFINPGKTPDQPEPNPKEWGDGTTNRPTESAGSIYGPFR
jgi:enterochelin esterase family protein